MALPLRSLAQFVRDIAPELIGKAVSPRARMRQMEKRLKLVGWQGFAGMVVGTLDMALWDALARDGRSSCGAARWQDTAATGV
jgi:mandelate racemase